MTHDAPVNLLFVEDSAEDVQLALRALRRDGVEALWRQVDSESAMKVALSEARPDAILSDFSMPGFDGLEALLLAREIVPQVPFIFLSGTIGEERAIAAIRMGATDYVLKSSMRRLGTAVKRALSETDERNAYETRIRYLANYDALSDLPNRSLLADRTAQAIAHARRTGRTCGLIVLNVDRFKLVNEGFGQAAGDALLKLLAERLRATVHEGDTPARLGADSFAVLAADLVRPDATMALVRKIQEAASLPFAPEGRELHVSLSIGASTFPRDGEDLEVLLRNADAAMQRVKTAGGNGFQYYAAAMTRDATERVELENALRVAPERGELGLHYQPQVEIASGRISGLEALMRWHHPERGLISPAQFIPIAEESDLIQSLGEWALFTACRQLSEWDASGHPAPPRVAVNVSARQFHSPGFTDVVARALRERRIDPSRLELELTESVLIDNREEAVAVLGQLKAFGVQIAVDDFGTGYSSLSYLSGLPVDCLKIDRSFVVQTTDGGRGAAIAQAIISLGHSLRLRVLAEGVETPEQLEFLRRHGCNEYQGYLFSRPCTVDAVSGLLVRGAIASKAALRTRAGKTAGGSASRGRPRGSEAAKRPVIPATYKGFKRNHDGSWTCVAESTIQRHSGRIQVMPGSTFLPGVKFMGVDLADLLDTLAGTKSIEP
jgi:diguanylate cyclase (GGDEF)-like protein